MSKLFLFIITILSLTIFQGCGLFIVPLEYALQAGVSEKDVSSDFERGHVIGKEYELLDNAYLSQLRGSARVRLGTIRIISETSDEDESTTENCNYLFSKVMPKGTRFRVCGVLVKTEFGNELCAQNILATLIDEQGHPLPAHDFHGENVPVYVTYLFENTHEKPDQNWTFKPNPKLIKEITN